MFRASSKQESRLSTWKAGSEFFAPSQTPAPIFARLRKELTDVLARPDVSELFAKTGGRVLKLSPEETEKLVRSDVERWTKLIKEAGVTAD